MLRAHTGTRLGRAPTGEPAFPARSRPRSAAARPGTLSAWAAEGRRCGENPRPSMLGPSKTVRPGQPHNPEPLLPQRHRRRRGRLVPGQVCHQVHRAGWRPARPHHCGNASTYATSRTRQERLIAACLKRPRPALRPDAYLGHARAVVPSWPSHTGITGPTSGIRLARHTAIAARQPWPGQTPNNQTLCLGRQRDEAIISPSEPHPGGQDACWSAR